MENMPIIEHKNQLYVQEQLQVFFQAVEDIEYTQHPSTKVTLKGLLGGVLTYDKDTGISTRFFGKSKTQVTQADVDGFVEFMEALQEDYDRVARSLLDLPCSVAMQVFLQRKIEESVKKISFFQRAVYFEAEKGASEYRIPEEQRQVLLEKVNASGEPIWGGEVKERAVEKEAVLCFLDGLLEHAGETGHTDRVRHFIAQAGGVTTQCESTQPDYQSDLEKKYLLREDMVALFAMHYRLHGFPVIKTAISASTQEPLWIDETCFFPKKWTGREGAEYLEKQGYIGKNKPHTKIIHLKDNVDNLSASTNTRYNTSGLNIPTTKKYDQVEISKVRDYLDHEQGTHNTRAHGVVAGVQQASAGYLEAEEGVAMLNEILTKYAPRTLKSVPPTEHNITKLIAEYLPGDQAKLVIASYYFLAGLYPGNEEAKAETRVVRLKRFGPLDLPYANPKDNAYNKNIAGFLDTIKAMSPEELEYTAQVFYSGKWSVADMAIAEALNAEVGVATNEVGLPVMVGKLLRVRAAGIDHKALANPSSDHFDPRFTINTQRRCEEIRVILEMEDFVKQKAFVSDDPWDKE